MDTFFHTLTVSTTAAYEVRDMTDEVKAFLESVRAKDGVVTVYTRHTTVAIKINEYEEGLLADIERLLFAKLVPREGEYRHNDIHHRDPATICPLSGGLDCANGHAHLAQMLLGSASESVPVRDGVPLLGTWQRILMFELDRPREREVVLTFQGTTAV